MPARRVRLLCREYHGNLIDPYVRRLDGRCGRRVEAFSVWSVKAEYLYAELGSQHNTIVYTYGPFTSSLTSTAQREQDNIVRFGVNYKLF